MRAISLRTLLLLVACVAFGVVVLGRPSLFWTRTALSLAVVYLGAMVVLAVCGSGNGRRFGVGAAVFGIGYFYLALCQPTRSHSNFDTSDYLMGRTLVTHAMLESLAPWLGHDQFPTTQINNLSLWDWQLFDTSSARIMTTGGGGFVRTTTASGATAVAPAENSEAETSDASPPPASSFFAGGGGGIPGAGGAFAAVAVAGPPPHTRYQQYLISGHCLFVMLIGCVAGGVVRYAFRLQRGPEA